LKEGDHIEGHTYEDNIKIDVKVIDWNWISSGLE
jgi:hypothetical protein